MNATSDLVAGAVRPVLVGTAFDRGDTVTGPPAQGGQPANPDGSASLLWCTPTSTFRQRHPLVPEALDPDHPDGCIDLIIEVQDGTLTRLEIEMLDLGVDVCGHPVGRVLPVVVERLRTLLAAPVGGD